MQHHNKYIYIWIVAYNAIDIAKKIICKTDSEHGDTLTQINRDGQFKTDEQGRIVLSENMREAVYKAEMSLADGACLTEQMFQTRFAKWL